MNEAYGYQQEDEQKRCPEMHGDSGNGGYYSLKRQKVKNASKRIYIKNGKKVIL